MIRTIKAWVPDWARGWTRPPRRLLQVCRHRLKQFPHDARVLSRRLGHTSLALGRRLAETSRVLSRRLLDASRLPRLLETSRLLCRFYSSYTRYCRTGVVPPDAPVTLPAVYMLTNGRLTDHLAARLARRLPPVEEPSGVEGVMPALSGAEQVAVLANLRRDGVHIFDRTLDPRVCDELVEFAYRTPCMPYGDHLQLDHPRIRFDPLNPVATTYWFDPQTLAEAAPVQRILTDPTILKVAQAYLGMEPILNIYTMWWSAAFKRSADSKSAQLFHFDLSRAKFLKVFVYLVDVGEQNGPHVYVRGTHGRKVRPLIKDSRISDEEMFSYYPRDRAVTVTGVKGTVFAADTAGFHKGLPIVAGTRLIFQLEYVSDRFGPSQPMVGMNRHFGDAFRAARQRHPRLLCRFSPEKTAATTAELTIV
jgi:hypothetical protein